MTELIAILYFLQVCEETLQFFWAGTIKAVDYRNRRQLKKNCIKDRCVYKTYERRSKFIIKY